MTLSETIKDLQSRTEALRRYLNIDTLIAQVAEKKNLKTVFQVLF